MVKIKKQLVPSNIANRVTYNGKNSKKYIVIHETANTNKGAHAQAHANLQSNGNSRQASWHYQVDDKKVIQSFSDDTQCWHAGNRHYNEQSIGIEICVNSDGDFKKAVDNAIELTKHLMSKYSIPASNVIQHNQASGKNCPRYLRAGNKGITWADFKASLTDKVTKPSKPSKPSKPTTSTYKGDSIVDYLKSVGQSSSFAHRKTLAVKHGIRNYTGTATQNLQLLRILRDGAKVKPTPTKPKPAKPQTFRVGQKVRIKSSAKKYSRANVTIPSKYKNKSLTIQQVNKNDVLIKELYSWVKKSDVQ